MTTECVDARDDSVETKGMNRMVGDKVGTAGGMTGHSASNEVVLARRLVATQEKRDKKEGTNCLGHSNGVGPTSETQNRKKLRLFDYIGPKIR